MNESYYAFILTELDHLLIRVVNAKTEQFVPQLSFRTRDDDQQFISDIPRIFKSKFKAVILEVFTHKPHGYDHNLMFCIHIRKAFEAINLPCYFINGTNKTLSTLLIATNICPKVKEVYLIVLVNDVNKLAAAELEFTESGYIKSVYRLIPIDEKEAPEKTRAKIIGSCNPKKIIVSSIPGNTILKHLRNNVLKSKKLIVLEALFTQYHDKFLVETVKWLLDKTYVKYFIQPFCARRNYIFTLSGPRDDVIIEAEAEEPLPLKKTVTVPQSHLDYFMVFVDNPTNETQLLDELDMPKTCHRHEITMIIDEQNFPKNGIKQIILDEIKTLPHNLDKHFPSKIPVIGIFDKSAVICINANKRYQFLASWNGIFGTELIINFSQEKYTVGDKAIELLDEPSFIVYDLIKIMSMEADKIVNDPSWNFTITEDSENPVLLEFDNFDGTKKAASPSFLMALILKEIRKLIKVEIGKKPKEFGFWIFKDQYKDEEIKRIEAKLVEACQLIKVSCEFVRF